ncbi:MAG: hypothetical protein QF466_00465 [Desulfobacterales bacterium]|nr:hypothetical protein [Desulfobacterales bacterium]
MSKGIFRASTVRELENMNIGGLLTKSARIHPDHLSLVHGRKRLTYAQFHARTNRLANFYMLGNKFFIMRIYCGHDSLFLRYSKAPCTVLAVKDRLLGHNPLAAIYNIDSYYRALK